MGFLLDSNVLIDLERGRIELEPHIALREDEEFFLSVITASELLHGVFHAQKPEQKNRRSAFVEAVLDRFPILDIDLSVARIHAQLWAQMESEGNMIGLHGSWIAATALAHGLTLVTANLDEFNRIPGLVCESWLE